MCGIDWCGFGGVIVCCVWERLRRVWLSEFVLCVGEFSAFWGSEVFSVCGREWCWFGGVSFCCVWERLGQVWGSDFFLCVGGNDVCLGE